MWIWLYKLFLGICGAIALVSWGLNDWRFWLAFAFIAWLMPSKRYDDIIIRIRRER